MPTKTQLKTFWFDLGNVILPFDFAPAYERLALHGADPDAIRGFFGERPWLEAACDTGKVPAPALYRMLRKHFSLRTLKYPEFKKIWNDIFEENREVSRLIRALKRQGFRLVLISNTNKLHFDHILRRYPVLREFHHHVLSYRLKTRKPGKKIYDRALRLSRAKKHQIFYTDDRKDFTGAAAGHGVHVHTFTHAARLKRALGRHGIKT